MAGQVLSVIAPGLRRPRRRTGDRWRRGWLSVSLGRRDLEAGVAQPLNDDFGRLCGVKDLRRKVAAAEEIGQHVLRGELALLLIPLSGLAHGMRFQKFNIIRARTFDPLRRYVRSPPEKSPAIADRFANRSMAVLASVAGAKIAPPWLAAQRASCPPGISRGLKLVRSRLDRASMAYA